VSGHEHERLSAYLDGELTREERAAVAEHVAACTECAARLAEFAAVDEATAALAAAPPSGYFEALPARLRSRLAARPVTRRLPAWTWAAAAALFLALVTPFVLQQRPEAVERREVSVAAPPPATTADTTSAPAAGGAPAAAEPSAAPRRAPAAAPASAPTPAAPAAKAAPAPEKSKQGFAAAPADADVRSTNAAAPAPAEARRDAAAAPAQPPAYAGVPAVRTNAQADLARQAAAAVAKEEAETRARDEAAAAEDKTVRAEAQVQAAQALSPAAPAAKAARSQASGRLAEELTVAPAKDSEEEWRRLQAVRPQGAAEWRRQREQLRRFADEAPAGPHADEARVRAIEAGYTAWRAGSDAADEAAFRRDAAAYLAREDARSKPRVEALLTEAGPARTP
jgi:hypothetical protein